MTDTPTDIPAVTTNLYNLLQPLQSEERKRVIKAALTMLGDDTSVANQKSEKGGAADDGDGDNSDFNSKARTWMSRNKVSAQELAHVFHVDGETVDIILDTVPGKNQKEQAINAYMLTGVAELLKTGDPKFTDKVARESCKKLGCYADTNHATYLKRPGKVLSGSKDSGWTLTGPGMKAAAELVKELTAERTSIQADGWRPYRRACAIRCSKNMGKLHRISQSTAGSRRSSKAEDFARSSTPSSMVRSLGRSLRRRQSQQI
jgi:hypothetical protein